MASVSQPTMPQTQGLTSFVPESSWIVAFEYDPQNLRLTTHLKSGAIYQHTFVLPAEYEALKTSQNHGKHWSNNIKGKHASVHVKKAKAPLSEVKHRR